MDQGLQTCQLRFWAILIMLTWVVMKWIDIKIRSFPPESLNNFEFLSICSPNFHSGSVWNPSIWRWRLADAKTSLNKNNFWQTLVMGQFVMIPISDLVWLCRWTPPLGSQECADQTGSRFIKLTRIRLLSGIPRSLHGQVGASPLVCGFWIPYN